MRISSRAALCGIASTALVLATDGGAVADDVDLTTSTPSWTVATDGIPTITLDLGQTGSVVLTYAEANPEKLSSGGGKPTWGPGLPGCELKGGQGMPGNTTQLALAVDDETDGVVTLGAGTVVFEDCVDEVDGVEVPATRTLTFAATAPGATLVSFEVDSAATVANEGAHFTAPDTFRVVVNDPDGRDAPAIANDYLHNTADEATLAACQAANGTNGNLSNWHGQLIGKVAQYFEGQTFAADQEYIVIDKVLELCGVGSTTG